MIFNMAGGGASLNFNVKAGSVLPASAAENTIFVITSTTMTEYQFSATQPTTRADGTALSGGEIWIIASTSSSGAFNAIKKNALNVYPATVKQYISGSWVALNAYVFKSGVWVQFSHAALDVVPNLIDYPASAWHLSAKDTMNSDGTIGMAARTGANTISYPLSPIDVTGFSTLTLTASTAQNGMSGTMYVAVRSTPTGTNLASASASETSSSATLDITSITGSAYIVIWYVWSSTFGRTCQGIKLTA